MTNTQKIIATVVAAAVLIATLALLAFYMKNGTQNVENGPAKTEAPATSLNKPTDATDPDMQAIESDLNSISDSDFGEDALSDQNVGL